MCVSMPPGKREREGVGMIFISCSKELTKRMETGPTWNDILPSGINDLGIWRNVVEVLANLPAEWE